VIFPDPTGGAQHEALLYSSAADLASQLAPRIESALAAGDPVVAVVDAPSQAALDIVLGPAAADIDFQDPTQVHSVPSFTVATRWARLGRRVTEPGRRAMVVGQHIEGLDCDPGHWARLDIALNVAIDGLPVNVLCPYRSPGADLPRLHATHPFLFTHRGPQPSPGFRLPHESVIEYPPPPPVDLGMPDAELDFDATGLRPVRRRVAGVADAAGLDLTRVGDLVLAINEIAANSIEHGPGRGRLQLWITDRQLVAEVADPGRMDVSFPGMVAPSAAGARGRGLWLASELCDVMQVWSNEHGTVFRLFINR